MKVNWPMVPLGEVLRHRKKFIEIDDSQTYKRCRVQLHEGVVLRDQVPGLEIKTKKQQVCQADEFLVAEIDAKLGGYGFVPDDLYGSIVSSPYFLFGINTDKLHRGFLEFFQRTPAFAEQVAAQGSTNYAAIRPSNVLSYKIPLPPLDEQRRIVARIESIVVRLKTVMDLQLQSAGEAKALLGSAMISCFETEPGHDWQPLRDSVVDIHNGWSPACIHRRVENGEWGVLKVGAVSFGSFDTSQHKTLPIGLNPMTEYEINSGDFLTSQANTVELVGACAVVTNMPPRLMLCDNIFRFRFKYQNELTARYFNYLLKSPPLREQIECGASGTSPTKKNISKPKILHLRIPTYTRATQRTDVEYFDGIFRKTMELAVAVEKVSAELLALQPPILDRAFKGEL